MKDDNARAATGLLVRNLSARRGERRVLTGLEFALHPGEALVLVGPNGAGKSTFIRVLAGLLPREAGELRFAGRDPRDDAEGYAGHLHLVGHRDGVKASMTVLENLHFWTRLLGGGAPAREALAAFGLGALADVPAAYLSAGQRRRLALSRLIAIRRPLWLLDEPAAGLDADGRGCLGEAIDQHRRHGGVLVMASHGELSLPQAGMLRLGEDP